MIVKHTSESIWILFDESSIEIHHVKSNYDFVDVGADVKLQSCLLYILVVNIHTISSFIHEYHGYRYCHIC